MGFGPLVDAVWLADHLDQVVVVDVRWSVEQGPGRAAFEAGHIPGAVFADLDPDLSAPPSPHEGRHPLPPPAAFAAAMGALGIGDTTPVVAYDDAGGVIAARLWWMLDAIGREVAVLDGGIQAWSGVGPGDLTRGPGNPVPVEFTPVHWPSERMISADALEASLGSDPVILDARSAARYADGSDLDPRPGHIPGARSAPAGANLIDGRWRPKGELRAHYGALGADSPDVVAYCGSGVTACADLLGRRRAGLPDGRLFVGSWSLWGADAARPVTQGPHP